MTENTNTRRHAMKVESYNQKVEILSPLVTSTIRLEEFNEEYLTTTECNKLHTLISKMHELRLSIDDRMNKGLEAFQNRDQKKELLKKLSALSVVELENLMNQSKEE